MLKTLEDGIMDLSAFYKNVVVGIDMSTDFGKRLRRLLDDVVSRLPEEPQFHLKGRIVFKSRLGGIKFWEKMLADFERQRLLGCKPPPFNLPNVDGHSSFAIVISPRSENKLEDSFYILTFITEGNGGLEDKTDSYVKGLIVHEFAEMSYKYRLIEKELPRLCTIDDINMRNEHIQKILFGNIDAHDPRYQQHESIADSEGIRLGFSEEIRALRQVV